MASIDISQARKSYGSVEVLHGVDLAVQDGEFIVLVGPSGCGKSTLLRMIAGLEDITSGAIEIGGRVVNDLAPRERDIAMVFQSYALYPHMTVAENIGYAMALRKTPMEKITAAVGGVSRTLGIDTLLERRPKALSGGQRQRVAMGRAIVRNPQAFLFDEPLSNLDARLREQMRFEIRKLHRELAATSVYVTHDQIEAMTMADKIVAMHDGVVQQIGSPLDIYDHPANIFVASFIGSPAMNFLTCRYVDDASRVAGGDSVAALHAGDGVVIPCLATDGLSNGASVVVGARPEHIHLSEPTATSVPAQVDLIEPMGLSTLIHVRVAGCPLKLFTLERPALELDSVVHVAFDMAKIHLFDAETERLI